MEEEVVRVVVLVEGRELEVVLLIELTVEESWDEEDVLVDRVVELVVAATFCTLNKHRGRVKNRERNLGKAAC